MRNIYSALTLSEKKLLKPLVVLPVSIYQKSGLKKSKSPSRPWKFSKKIVKILDKFTELEVTLEAELALRKRQYRYYRDFLLDFDNQIGLVDS